MNRRLLFVLIAAALTPSCATQRTPEVHALTSDIFGAAARTLACRVGEAPYCLSKGSRIKSVNQNMSCECGSTELVIDARFVR
jgi:hypothetical protein